MGNCFASIFRKSKVRRHIVLILIGLDNAGKTKTVNNLAGENDGKVLPTVGFKAVNLVHKATPVTIYDLGGGPHFRQIWPQYYSEVHGVIFVIDSSDYSRLEECKIVLEEVLSHDKISGNVFVVFIYLVIVMVTSRCTPCWKGLIFLRCVAPGYSILTLSPESNKAVEGKKKFLLTLAWFYA